MNSHHHTALLQGERFLCERCYQLSTQSAAAAAGASSIAVAHTPVTKTETPKYSKYTCTCMGERDYQLF